MPTSRQTSRRQFLQGIAAAGAAGILLPSANRAFGYQSANERPVFATIGLRNQGWTITSKSFRFADFAALADVDANVLGTNVDKVERQVRQRCSQRSSSARRIPMPRGTSGRQFISIPAREISSMLTGTSAVRPSRNWILAFSPVAPSME